MRRRVLLLPQSAIVTHTHTAATSYNQWSAGRNENIKIEKNTRREGVHDLRFACGREVSHARHQHTTAGRRLIAGKKKKKKRNLPSSELVCEHRRRCGENLIVDPPSPPLLTGVRRTRRLLPHRLRRPVHTGIHGGGGWTRDAHTWLAGPWVGHQSKGRKAGIVLWRKRPPPALLPGLGSPASGTSCAMSILMKMREQRSARAQGRRRSGLEVGGLDLH